MARREDPLPLHQLLPSVLARLARESGKAHSLTPVWNAAVGPHLARLTRPHTLEGGKLVVTVPDAEWARTLSQQQEELIERLNERLGPGTVRALACRLEG
jgi:predicted nucleic acid-binding Zn ribbon protein